MPKGGKRKPTELHAIEGTKSRSPNSKEAFPDVINPDPPKELLDEHGQAEFKRMAKVLSKNGLLTEADLSLFTAYSIVWQKIVWAQMRFINGEEDMTQINVNTGHESKSGTLAMQETAITQLIKLASEFGMSPVARTRAAAIQNKKAGDGWDDFE